MRGKKYGCRHSQATTGREKGGIRSLFGWYKNIYSCVYPSCLWLHPDIIQAMTVTDCLDCNRICTRNVMTNTKEDTIISFKRIADEPERPCFALRKAVNCTAKDRLLACKRRSFANSLAASRLAVHKGRAVQTGRLDGSRLSFGRLLRPASTAYSRRLLFSPYCRLIS